MRSILRLLPLAAILGLTACPGAHRQPTGPAPEYEDPPPPSWQKDGGAPAAPVTVPLEPLPISPVPARAPTPDGGVS